MTLYWWVVRLWRRWVDCTACHNTGRVGFASGHDYPCFCGRPLTTWQDNPGLQEFACKTCHGYRLVSRGVMRIACPACTAPLIGGGGR